MQTRRKCISKSARAYAHPAFWLVCWGKVLSKRTPLVDFKVIRMAELQGIVEVRCVNALLAEMKVGETGEHIIINIPDREFDPSEFDKLIEGHEVSSQIAEENKRSSKNTEIERGSASIEAGLGGTVEIIEERDLYGIKILKTGEIVSVNVPEKVFAPSEFNRFMTELKAIRSKMKS